MDDLLQEFLAETNENLQELDIDLIKLEQNPNDSALLSQIFRIMHTIKGTCGFLGLPRLETVAHSAENVLGRFRDGELLVTPEYVTIILEALDRVRFILSELGNSGQEPEGDDSELIEKLSLVLEPPEGELPQSESTENVSPVSIDETDESLKAAILQGLEENHAEDKANKQAPHEAEAKKSTKADKDKILEKSDLNMLREPVIAVQSLRVNVDVLENLMTMVSELVLTRNQLLQIVRGRQDSEFTVPLQRLNHVVSDLQEGVMKTRMQPIGNAWAKLPRIIRDVCRELDKKIQLEMRGKDTELDRQVLDMIKDPLTHMVRNSADHGIEAPGDREKAGKPEEGLIKLNAFHEGGHIIIEISDDGRGLSTERIKAKALENEWASAKELNEMSDSQIQQFIFKPGFSTADQITSVSGRGVGMDVVRTNIEKIGGSIELKSKEHVGTKFTIKIPLTLAIVSALIVEAAGERFAIPQLSVRELVMVSENGTNQIEMIKGTPVFRLRDHLLPLVPLDSFLKLQKEECTEEIIKPSDPREGLQETGEPENSEANQDTSKRKRRMILHQEQNNKYIVVAQVGAYVFGIVVDRVYDTEEIVVKPVASVLRNIDIFSGNTILGDGSVIMILDPAGVAKQSVKIEAQDTMDVAKEMESVEKEQEKTSLLLFSAGGGSPKAVPLALVSRLEEIEAEQVEWADDQMVVQYRGHLMPLIPFNDKVTLEEGKPKPILVFADENHSMGLIVDQIIDIIEEHVNVQVVGHDNLIGSAIINSLSTDVIDVTWYLKQVNHDWFKTSGEANAGGEPQKAKARRRVLLVEDSPFFRNMLTPLLSAAGYEVTTANSASRALELYEAGEKFDIIVSDIEMPEMSGFEFAEKIKNSGKWKDIPMIALSSHATPQDQMRGKEAGFKDYVAKFDRESLLTSLSDVLSPSAREETP